MMHRLRLATINGMSPNTRKLVSAKVINKLLTEANELKNLYDANPCEWILKQKLLSSSYWVMVILRECDVNYTDNNGQTVLHVFLEKYIPVYRLIELKKYSKITEAVKKLLQRGASVHIADKRGNTPMHIAAKQEGMSAIFELMLDYFTDVNACDSEGSTLLHIIVCKGEEYLYHVKTLLRKGANVRIRDKNYMTPIHLAALQNYKALYIFLKHGIDLNDNELLRFLCKSSLHENFVDEVKTIELIIDQGCDVNATNRVGWSLLHYAAKYRSSSVIDMLIDRGAVVTCQTKKNKRTPLHLAVNSGRLDAVNILLKSVVDVDVVDVNGLTPLHYSLLKGGVEIINCLIDRGAKVYQREIHFGFTSIHLSVFSPSLKLLLSSQVSVDVLADGGITPLHLALLEGNDGAVEYLIEQGADVNLREQIFGFTPMHLTAFAVKKVVELLAAKDCDVNVTTDKGITPLHLAAMLGNVDVARALIDRGADVNCRDHISGSTPLHWSVMHGEVLNLKSLTKNQQQIDDDKSLIGNYWNLRFSNSSVDTYFGILSKLSKNRTRSYVTLKPTHKMIEVLLESGSVIDVRDNDDRLPLDNILKNNYHLGLEYLLEYGADINEAIVSSKIFACQDSARPLALGYVAKLFAAGLPIAKSYCNYFDKHSFYHAYVLQESMRLEVHEMKAKIVADNVSFYDVLHMNPKRRSAFAKSVMRFDLKARFPEYFAIIWSSCREAIDRPQIIEAAEEALFELSNFNLPSLCVEHIFSYLNSGNLRALIDAAGISYVDVSSVE